LRKLNPISDIKIYSVMNKNLVLHDLALVFYFFFPLYYNVDTKSIYTFYNRKCMVLKYVEIFSQPKTYSKSFN
jgi:hypothetical protein